MFFVLATPFHCPKKQKPGQTQNFFKMDRKPGQPTWKPSGTSREQPGTSREQAGTAGNTREQAGNRREQPGTSREQGPKSGTSREPGNKTATNPGARPSQAQRQAPTGARPKSVASLGASTQSREPRPQILKTHPQRRSGSEKCPNIRFGHNKNKNSNT